VARGEGERMKGRVLIIAGSDSSGGAGIQADIKTVSAFCSYAATAISAVTVQNTLGVTGVHEIPAEIVRAQIQAVMSDIGADVIKTGMLSNAAIVREVAAALDEEAKGVPAIIDPVMIAKGGQSLLSAEAVATVKSLLLPRAFLATPNAPEAETLTGVRVADVDGQKRAGEALLKLGAKAALVKGGHVPGDNITDVLATPAGFELFEGPRIATRATHGTGCTLASAIATLLAQGETLPDAVDHAREYLMTAIKAAPNLGQGAGPLQHCWPQGCFG
jgi:hydroxymethylpyrimidine/phosphomethylpyrimidine kinase